MKLKFIIIIALSISNNMAFAQEWNLTGRLFDKAAGSLPLEATEIIVSHLDGETISSGFLIIKESLHSLYRQESLSSDTDN